MTPSSSSTSMSSSQVPAEWRHSVPMALPGLGGNSLLRKTPRQFALEPNGKILLVTNTDSGQLQSVNLAHLP